MILIVGAGLTACSSFSPTKWSYDTMTVGERSSENNTIDSLISPYRDSIEDDMAEIVARSTVYMEKGRPCSVLNNWVADALLVDQIKELGAENNGMVLLNVGGLRGTLGPGLISKGDMFTLMPFDNEVVWVKMPIAAISAIEKYLRASGGEPIANAQMKNGVLSVNILNPESNTFWIITSDYLMNGGDKMSFFEQKLEVIHTGVLLRDVLMRQAKHEGTLQIDNTCRIHVD